MIWTLVIFTLANIILAFIDSRIIQAKHKILHGINGAVYLAALLIPWFMYHNLWFIGCLALNRLLVFNIMLSLFRRLKWYYISPMPAAITDKFAGFIFRGNGKLMYRVYLIVFITLTVLTFAS